MRLQCPLVSGITELSPRSEEPHFRSSPRSPRHVSLLADTRRLAALAAVALLLVTVGCGHSKVNMRAADVLQCVDQARKTPVVLAGGTSVTARVIGWLSIASVDRWVKQIDNVGQRAGLFAPGSSYRDHLRGAAAKLALPLGVEGVEWMDESRPHYLVMQEQGATRYKGQAMPAKTAWVFGFSALLPTKGSHAFDKALREEVLLDDTGGHARALKVRGKTLWVDPINYYTEVMTLHPDRFALATPAAQCLHDRTPRKLLHVGVAVSDLYRHYRPQIEALLSSGIKRMPKSPLGAAKTSKALKGFTKWLGESLEQTDIVELSADANERALRFGLAYRALPGTAAAKRVAKMSEAKANTLLSSMPAKSWWVVGQSYTGLYDASDYDDIFEMYAKMFDLEPEVLTRLKVFTRDYVNLLGDHGASAMYVDGRFPFAYVNALQSKDPEGLVTLMTNGVVDFIKLVEKASEKANKLTGVGSKLVTPRAKAMLERLKTGGFGGLLDELIKKSQAWRVKLAYKEVKNGKLRCRVLSAEADMAKLATNKVAMRVVAFTGRTLQLSLCTTDKLLLVLMGPNTVDEAKRLLKGGGATLSDSKAFKRVMAGEQPPMTVFMLDPGPLVKIFGKMLPIPILWPEDEALSMTCRAKGELFSCNFDLPLAVIDIGRQVYELTRAFRK